MLEVSKPTFQESRDLSVGLLGLKSKCYLCSGQPSSPTPRLMKYGKNLTVSLFQILVAKVANSSDAFSTAGLVIPKNSFVALNQDNKKLFDMILDYLKQLPRRHSNEAQWQYCTPSLSYFANLLLVLTEQCHVHFLLQAPFVFYCVIWSCSCALTNNIAIITV